MGERELLQWSFKRTVTLNIFVCLTCSLQKSKSYPVVDCSHCPPTRQLLCHEDSARLSLHCTGHILLKVASGDPAIKSETSLAGGRRNTLGCHLLQVPGAAQWLCWHPLSQNVNTKPSFAQTQWAFWFLSWKAMPGTNPGWYLVKLEGNMKTAYKGTLQGQRLFALYCSDYFLISKRWEWGLPCYPWWSLSVPRSCCWGYSNDIKLLYCRFVEAVDTMERRRIFFFRPYGMSKKK